MIQLLLVVLQWNWLFLKVKTIERIWNTIETTLFFYSDNSTTPQVWMHRNNFSPLHQRILLPTSSLIKFRLERLKQMASEFLKISERNPNKFHSHLVSQVRILSFLEQTASNIIVFCTKNMIFFLLFKKIKIEHAAFFQFWDKI